MRKLFVVPLLLVMAACGGWYFVAKRVGLHERRHSAIEVTTGSPKARSYVLGWGNDAFGQVTGTPKLPDRLEGFAASDSLYATGLVMIAGQPLTEVMTISAGAWHALALRADGTVVGWGSNFGGKTLGYETPPPHRNQGVVKVGGQVVAGVQAVSAGWASSMLLQRDGTVRMLGDGFDWTPMHDPQASPADRERLEQLRQGMVMPPNLSNIFAVSAGRSHALVLHQDGTVTSWGLRTNVFAGVSESAFEQSGDEFVVVRRVKPPGRARDLVAVTAARYQPGMDIGLRRDGSVIQSTGGGGYQVVSGLSNVVQIASGAAHALALKSDGTVFGWGSDFYGQATGVANRSIEPAAAVSRGLVKLRGEVLSKVVSIAVGEDYNLALRKDGTVVGWGSGRHHMADVPEGLSNIVAVAVGSDFCLAITTNKVVAERFMPAKP